MVTVAEKMMEPSFEKIDEFIRDIGVIISDFDSAASMKDLALLPSKIISRRRDLIDKGVLKSVRKHVQKELKRGFKKLKVAEKSSNKIVRGLDSVRLPRLRRSEIVKMNHSFKSQLRLLSASGLKKKYKNSLDLVSSLTDEKKRGVDFSRFVDDFAEGFKMWFQEDFKEIAGCISSLAEQTRDLAAYLRGLQADKAGIMAQFEREEVLVLEIDSPAIKKGINPASALLVIDASIAKALFDRKNAESKSFYDIRATFKETLILGEIQREMIAGRSDNPNASLVHSQLRNYLHDVLGAKTVKVHHDEEDVEKVVYAWTGFAKKGERAAREDNKREIEKFKRSGDMDALLFALKHGDDHLVMVGRDRDWGEVVRYFKLLKKGMRNTFYFSYQDDGTLKFVV